LWFLPYQDHQLIARSGDAQYHVAVFKPGMVQSTCQREPYSKIHEREFAKDHILNTSLSTESFDLLERSMSALIVDGLDSNTLNREAGFGLNSDFKFSHKDPDWLNAGLRHLLLLAWRCQMGREVSQKEVQLHPAVSKAIHWIQHAEDSLTLNDLSRRCGLSAPYLSKLFHQQIGVSISDYRNAVRLRRFNDTYRTSGGKTMMEAVFDAGFGSYAQFFRVFTQAYHKSPRQALHSA